MKTSFSIFLTLLIVINTTSGQGTVSITPAYVAGYARDFLLPVDNGLYYGSLYGAVSNSPSPSLLPIFPTAVIDDNFDAIEIRGSHLTFPNPLTLGFPAGTPLLLQAQIWVGSLGPFWTHYNSAIVLVTLGSTSPPTVDFGTIVVPLVPEPSSAILAVIGMGLLLFVRRRV